MLNVITLSVIMLSVTNKPFRLSVIMLIVVMQCHYAECRGAFFSSLILHQNKLGCLFVPSLSFYS
jgi:hypothetical protein